MVDAYPIVERHGIVWIWMGDKERGDPKEVFDIPQFTDPKWHAHHGDALYLKSNYLNVAENLVDPAHVSFVHPTTLGNSSSEDIPVHVSTEGEAIVAWRWVRNSEPIGLFKALAGYSEDDRVDRWQYYNLYVPSTAVVDSGCAPVDMKIKEDERDRGVRVLALHFMTPVDEDHTIDRWMHLRNVSVGSEDISNKIDELFKIAFNEDREILEAVHAEELRPQKRRPIRIAIDRGPMVYRRHRG